MKLRFPLDDGTIIGIDPNPETAEAAACKKRDRKMAKKFFKWMNEGPVSYAFWHELGKCYAEVDVDFL